jgi:hypothetical protein
MDTIIELFRALTEKIISLASRFISWAWTWFMDLNIFDKALVITGLPAILAVAKPSARFFMMETWFYMNNPMAESMIGMVFLAAISFILPPLYSLFLRAVPGALYFCWMIYLQASHTLFKIRDPYELTVWHYLNLTVPAALVILSVLSYLLFHRDRG